MTECCDNETALRNEGTAMRKYRVTMTVNPTTDDESPTLWFWEDLLGCPVEIEEIESVAESMSTKSASGECCSDPNCEWRKASEYLMEETE